MKLTPEPFGAIYIAAFYYLLWVIILSMLGIYYTIRVKVIENYRHIRGR